MSTIDDGFTLEERQALLKELKEAFYSGVSRVRFREREVFYRSLDEMKQAISDLEQAIAPPARKRRVILTTFNRGYR